MIRPELIRSRVGVAGGSDALVQHIRHVLGPRRQRCQAHSEDAAGEQVHRHGQLHPNPAHSDRFHREHIQRGGIEHHVLPRTGRAQSAEDTAGPVRHRPPAFRATERVPPLRQCLHPPVCRAQGGQRHHARPEFCFQVLGNGIDDRADRRGRDGDVAVEHPHTCCVPPVIDTGGVAATDPTVRESGNSCRAVSGDPAVQGAHRDVKFRRSGGQHRFEFGAGDRNLGEEAADVFGSCFQFLNLGCGQRGEHYGSRVSGGGVVRR